MTARPAEAVLFPAPKAGRVAATSVVLDLAGDGVPGIVWLGVPPTDVETFAADVAAGLGHRPATPLLVEHSRGSYRRPGLRGYRDTAASRARDWSPAFVRRGIEITADRLVIDADDTVAGLALRSELETLPGGALRLRHRLTNIGAEPYRLDALEIGVPAPDRSAEYLDLAGRHERERTPQRGVIRDGLWSRENRRGRTGLESASFLAAGETGFDFERGAVTVVHLAWSGNSVYTLERDQAGQVAMGAGELLLPGELELAAGESYATPWMVVVAGDGLDDVALSVHAWQRSLPAHPDHQPVVLNVWEAVYFDHDLDRLLALAERAARVGVERFVLDDGWFLGRRDDHAGLGDWTVDHDVWPEGLHPLVKRVRELGMEFGLWFEPEMVNPDSDLYRAHPDWVLSVGERTPLTSRNQLVLDLTRPDVFDYLVERMDAVLQQYDIAYVKWDHNRDVLEAGGSDHSPVAHRQAAAHYAMLDELRRRHPTVAWESCAAGGGRIDLGVLERVQRVWTSDMTDARSRQAIQRWTVQIAAPEYLGAHVSAPISHQTGRAVPLDFRAATSLFGAFGIEWDLTRTVDDDLDRLAAWVARFKCYRGLLHGGRTVRPTSDDDAVLLHGVVALDGSRALMAHVQLDEAASNRGVAVRIPHLRPDAQFALTWAGPVDEHPMSQSPAVSAAGPTGGVPMSGLALGTVGVWVPRRRPDTILLIDVREV